MKFLKIEPSSLSQVPSDQTVCPTNNLLGMFVVGHTPLNMYNLCFNYRSKKPTYIKRIIWKYLIRFLVLQPFLASQI